MGLSVYIRLNTIIGITKNFWYYQKFLVSSFGTQKGAQRRLQVKPIDPYNLINPKPLYTLHPPKTLIHPKTLNPSEF